MWLPKILNRKVILMTEQEKLADIESRFYGWSYLSEQQDLDITWLIKTLKGKLKETGKISEIEITKLPNIKVLELPNLADNKIYLVQNGKIAGIIEGLEGGN